jgi:hypothetical protein
MVDWTQYGVKSLFLTKMVWGKRKEFSRFFLKETEIKVKDKDLTPKPHCLLHLLLGLKANQVPVNQGKRLEMSIGVRDKCLAFLPQFLLRSIMKLR